MSASGVASRHQPMNWHDSIGFQTLVTQKAFPNREARSVSFPIQRTKVTRVTRDVLLCFVLFIIQGLCQFQFEISLTTLEHVGHQEDLEIWLSVATDSLLPKAAETLKHQKQDQLDDNITSLMGQDPSQSCSHKELAKITSSLSHTLIATLKLSDMLAAQLQQEMTLAQRRIEQLELEA